MQPAGLSRGICLHRADRRERRPAGPGSPRGCRGRKVCRSARTEQRAPAPATAILTVYHNILGFSIRKSCHGGKSGVYPQKNHILALACACLSCIIRALGQISTAKITTGESVKWSFAAICGDGRGPFCAGSRFSTPAAVGERSRRNGAPAFRLFAPTPDLSLSGGETTVFAD